MAMTITKAREILDDLALTGEVYLNPDEIDAQKLGKEALREVERLRSCKSFHVVKLLPGETKE